MIRYLFKISLIAFGVICFVLACQEQVARQDLTDVDDMFRDRDTGLVMPQAIRVIPGSSWASWVLGDSIITNGFALMSQDSSNSKERIITDEAMISWLVSVLPDSFALSGYADTLTISNDSLVISNRGAGVEMNHVNVKSFGAIGNGVADDSLAFANAITYAGGQKIIYVPPGNYMVGGLEIPNVGFFLTGAGISDDAAATSKITHSGTGSLIKLAAGFTSGARKIRIENIELVGNANTDFGIDFGVASIYGARIENVKISGISKVGSYAIDMENTYNVLISGLRLLNNRSGILLRGVCQANVIANSWIVDFNDYGVHANGIQGRTVIMNTIIDAPGGAYAGLIGFYQDSVVGSTSGVMVDKCHFEDNSQNILIDTGYFWINSSVLGNPSASADSIVDGVTAFLSDIQSQTSTKMKLGLGTTWTRMTGRFTMPYSTDQTTITAPSTLIEVNSTGATNINGFQQADADRFEGVVTLRFMDGNTTLLHNSGTVGRLILFGSQNWTPESGDYIVLRKYKHDGTSNRFVEIGRYSANGKTTSPYLIGGSSTTSDLTLQTTTGVGATGADMHFLVGNAGATEAMTILNSGNVGIGNTSPTHAVDILASNGGQFRISNSNADNVTKNAYFDVTHYDIQQKDFILFLANAQSTLNTLSIGGGTSLGTAATNIRFYTAANNTTATGTERGRWNEGGELQIGSTSDQGAYNLQVTGNVYISGNITLGTISITVGSGSPEGAVTANVGSTFHRTDGGAGTSFYVKESGTGNTGWVAK